MERRKKSIEPNIVLIEDLHTIMSSYQPHVLGLIWAIDAHKNMTIPFFQELLEDKGLIPKISYVQFIKRIKFLDGIIINLERTSANKPYTITLNHKVTDKSGNLDKKKLNRAMQVGLDTYVDTSFHILDGLFS